MDTKAPPENAVSSTELTTLTNTSVNTNNDNNINTDNNNSNSNADGVNSTPNTNTSMVLTTTNNTLTNDGPREDIPVESHPHSSPEPTKDPYKLTIAFRDVDVLLKLPLRHTTLPNITTPFMQFGAWVKSLILRKPSTRDFYRLKETSGIIQPGSMTLVVSAPGHGRSSYLKMISTMIKNTSGNVVFNGVPVDELSKQNVDVKKLVTYQEQTDIHLSLLNVHETIEFASQMGSVDGHNKERIDHIISALGLDECKSTLIGDQLVKGISGGQKKRVSTGVCMSSDAVCLCLDQYSDGLDSAVTESITNYFYDWTKANQTSVVATLQQPTPAVFNKFENIVLLREGQVIFQGKNEDTLPFLEAMGFKCGNDVDACDFIVDVLSQPRQALYNIKVNEFKEKQLNEKRKKKAQRAARKVQGNNNDKQNGTTSTDGTNSPNDRQTEQLLALQQENKIAGRVPGDFISTTLGSLRCSPTPCLTTEEMVEYYHSSPFWKVVDTQLNEYIQVDKGNDNGNDENYVYDDNKMDNSNQKKVILPHKDDQILDKDNKFRTGFRLPFLETIKYAVGRSRKILLRNKAMLLTKWINQYTVTLIISALFYQVPRDNPSLRVAAILLSMSQAIYNNMTELSTVNNDKKIVMREIQQSMYTGIAYVISSFAVALPFTILDGFVFTCICYFMEGFYLGAQQFFVFWFLLVLTTWAAWFWFRACAILMPDLPRSLIVASPTVSYMNTFAGFYISRRDLEGSFWIALYWFSPFSWLVRAFAINEFKSSAYDTIIVNALTGENARQGDAFLDYVAIQSDDLWILWCTVYIVCWCILLTIVQALLLLRTPPEPTMGTRRVKDVGDDDQIDFNTLEAQLAQNAETEQQQHDKMQQLTNTILHSQQEHASKVHTKTATKSTYDDNHEPSVSALSRTQMTNIVKTGLGGDSGNKLKTLTEELPFYPTTISFSNISYTVRVKDLAGNTYDRKLLNNINGFAQPGDLAVLFGASGAGKSTLLDVLAGLKNQGVMTGKILFNGVETTKEVRGVLTGYVQQFPSLWGFSSVEETLLFAARLKMGKEISEELKRKVVEEILDILDLNPIRNFIVGNFMTPGLSPSQLKRVSIGVELVSNPAVLFLDEPTTGLDSKSAATVLKVVRRIASTGRTCIATIHQPSAELYYYFSHLYLLAPGGYQIFGGAVGYRSRSFVKYFSEIPGINSMEPRSNPANWMLTQASKTPESQYLSVQYIKTNTTIFNNDDDGDSIDEEQWTKLPPNKQWILYLKWHYLHASTAWYHMTQDLNTIENIFYTQNPQVPRIEHKGPDRLTQKQLDHIKEKELATATSANENEQQGPQQDKGEDNTTDAGNNDNQVADNDTASTGLHTPQHPAVLFQLYLLFCRHFTLYFRNPGAMRNRFLVLVSTSVITGLIYLDFQVKDLSSTISYMAGIVMAVGTFCFNIANSNVPLYMFHRPVFYREKAQGFYSYIWIWSFANTLNELVWCLPLTIISAIPIWFMIGYPSSADIFFKYLLVCYVTIVTFVSAQQFFSALVPNLGFSQICTSILTGLTFVLNGIGTTLAVLREVSGFHEALYWMLPLGPFNLFLANAIFDARPTATIEVVDAATGDRVTVLLKEFAQQFFGYNPDLHWWYFCIILIQLCCWQVAYQLATTFLDHNKR